MDSMRFQEVTIDLRRPPGDRWVLTPAQCEQARELFAAYQADLGAAASMLSSLTSVAKAFIDTAYWQEMQSIARQLDLPMESVVLCNCYYDVLKLVLHSPLSCTAFAVETPHGILHARNLDWWTTNSALARHTTLCRYTGGAAGEFTIIGWPGFVGAFSGIAPGRFAITLNAVLSSESPRLATPVVFLLRKALETAASFDEALSLLAESPLPCDCLLLISGTRAGEMAVIERTPTQQAIRRSSNGYCSVTNGFLQLDPGWDAPASELGATACQRQQRVDALVERERPLDPEKCFEYLADAEVRMKMTVQQMVFCAASGECCVRTPLV